MNAGDLIVITVQGTTGQFAGGSSPGPVMFDPAGRNVGTYWNGTCDWASDVPSTVCGGQWLRVETSGTFRVLVRDSGYMVRHFGGYAIRARHVTTTVPGSIRLETSGNSVSLTSYVHLSPAPVLEYAVEAGSAPYATDIGMVSLGARVGSYFTATFDGVPSGTYFVRVRARTASGWGPARNEQSVTTTDGPERLYASVTGNTVRLGWFAPAFNSPFYNDLKPVFPAVANPSSSFELLVGSSPGSTSLGIYNVGMLYGYVAEVPPGTYYVRVRGRTPAGVTAPSNEVVVRVP